MAASESGTLLQMLDEALCIRRGMQQSIPIDTLLPQPSPILSPMSDLNGMEHTVERDSLAVLVERALALANRADWLADFLMKGDASADVAMLTAPVALSAACSADVSDVSMEISSEHLGALDSDVSVAWALVPSFCAAGVSCGAAVTKLRVARGSVVTGEMSIGRYIRDESTAEFLLCKRDTTAPYTISLIYMKHLNSCERERMYIRFDKQKFDDGERHGAVLFSSSLRERRFCPVCSAAPSSGCGCRLPLRKPAHPLDFTTSNMATHAGEFVGQSAFRTLYGPHKGLATMLSRCSVVGGTDASIIVPLTQWAVQARMAEVDPLRCVMPSSLPEITPTSARRNKADSKESTCVLSAFPVGTQQAAGQPFSLSSLTAAGSGNLTLTSGLNPFSGQTWGTFLQCAAPDIEKVGSSSASANDVKTTEIEPTKTKEQEEEEARAARKHRRKLKNREAAARSNKKRKENYENLQQDVLDIREKSARLKERLHALQSENEELKRKVGEQQTAT